MLLIFTLMIMFMLSGCGGVIPQFYYDDYYSEDKLYENKDVGFILSYQGKWIIYSDPNEFDRDWKKLARSYHTEGAELMFLGATVDGLNGTQGVVEALNTEIHEYATLYRKNKLPYFTELVEPSEIIVNDNLMIIWEYTNSTFQFIDYLFRIDLYNIRISFYAKPEIFKRYRNVYLDIISSIEL